jgi:hypothetical protein
MMMMMIIIIIIIIIIGAAAAGSCGCSRFIDATTVVAISAINPAHQIEDKQTHTHT